MGVSIGQWRAAIGCFTSGISRSSLKNFSSSSSRISKFKPLFFVLILAIFSSQISPVFFFNLQQKTSRNSSWQVNQHHQSYSCQPSAISFTTTKCSTCTGASLPPTLPSTTTSSSLYLSGKKRNKLARSANGNRANRGIKLAHWNAGSAHP